MSNGPLPTTITFLTHLPSHAKGTKVRFLGCVTKYNLPNGILELQHAYHSPSATATIALVDVNLLLENLKREDTVVGAWVNIVGYLEGVSKESKKGKKMEGNAKQIEALQVGYVKVQAIMLWSAGGVRIGDYERALQGRLEMAVGDS